ncbi:GcrA family cell cycle regulator [Methylocystis sp. WRRC1]|uniref:GcrA family cell cycle regulator n=1 Tax=Methylocystis sp. WRRC1 TaxID=1732014 RepID=UPI001D156192|nr:GcrA family cell cycle regulator [Methylocystis sp. WRRC1]MCC3246701.1 GcrA family cell cycle regulator [Methylocystis sp. WRRC1]
MAIVNRPWTEKEIEIVRDMWGTAASAAEIGKLLGRTKNSVIGRAHRMGLANAAKPQHAPITKPPRPAKARKPKERELSVPEIIPPPIDHIEIPEGVSFADLRANGCRWVIGNPEDLTCCGAPASHAGSAWCSHHRALVYVRPRKRDRSKLSKYYR